jgi:hypothetical protein
MQNRSKGKTEKKCSSWYSRLGFWFGANDSTLEKFTVTKLTETKPDGTEDHGGGQDPHRVLAPQKKNCN